MEALVVGGGIGGLTSALSLRRAGFEVTVLERGPELREIGAGLAIWVGALRALDALGVGDCVRAAAAPLGETGRIQSRGGRVLMRVPMHRFIERYGEFAVGIHRVALHRVLADALGREAVRLDAECLGAERRGRRAFVLLPGGERLEADLVVGADGFNSPVARAVAGPLGRRYAGYTVWRGIAVGGSAAAGHATWESWGAGTEFGGFPVAGGDWYVYAAAVRRAGEPHPRAGHEADLLATFAGWHEPVAQLIRLAGPGGFHRNDLYDREVPRRFHFGRVALVGDAAHPMRPHLGMGACQAIEDGWALGACIARERDVDAGLAAYSAQRVPRTRAMVRDSKPAGELIKLRRAFLPQARDLSMRLTPDRLAAALFERQVRPPRELARARARAA
jgi:2-polyprenyl-6-methoxyphenol hydroxylase-like FAD-dependent oxidoreductase